MTTTFFATRPADAPDTATMLGAVRASASYPLEPDGILKMCAEHDAITHSTL